MTPPSFLHTALRQARLILEVVRLPGVTLHFDSRRYAQDVIEIYRRFTAPHPRYKVFGHKALGVALLDLRSFDTRAAYLHSVEGKGNAAPQSRKATARGYTIRQIQRNDHIDEIHQINTSCAIRQGRPMDEAYQVKAADYVDRQHVLYFGVFDKADTLVAYCNIGRYGNFAATEQLLGYKNNDGVMYFLFTEIVGHLIDGKDIDFFMYDTFFGAMDGLRDFKRRVGFRPYRARYVLD